MKICGVCVSSDGREGEEKATGAEILMVILGCGLGRIFFVCSINWVGRIRLKGHIRCSVSDYLRKVKMRVKALKE